MTQSCGPAGVATVRLIASVVGSAVDRSRVESGLLRTGPSGLRALISLISGARVVFQNVQFHAVLLVAQIPAGGFLPPKKERPRAPLMIAS